MKQWNTIKCLTLFILGVTAFNASANSVSLDQSEYPFDSNVQIVVTITYDFTDFAMFFGALDLHYDENALEFVSYARANLDGTDAQSGASPIGSHVSPGLYSGFGIGTFDFSVGMNSEGVIGVFVFNVLGYGTGTLGCEEQEALCLTGNATFPFTSLMGQNVTEELLGNGMTSANTPLPVPLPAAVWLLLSGLGVFAGLCRTRFHKL